jgi:hypothetical protein
MRIEVDSKTKESTRKAEEKRKNLNEGQWEDRKQWSLGVVQCIKSSETDIYIYIYIYIYTIEMLHLEHTLCGTKSRTLRREDRNNLTNFEV